METPSAWSVLTSVASLIVVWFDLIKSALSSLAWPVTVLTALLVFRRDVVALLSKLAAIKAGGFEASFGQQVHQLDPLPPVAEVDAIADAVDVVAGAEAGAHSQENTETAGVGAVNSNGSDDLHANDRTDTVDTALGANSPKTATPRPSSTTSQKRERSRESELKKRQLDYSLYSAFLSSTGRKAGVESPSDLGFWNIFQDFILTHSIDATAAKDLREARTIAPNSPSGAVLLAWRAIEGVIQQLLEQPELVSSSSSFAFKHRRNPSTVMRELISSGQLDSETYDRFFELQKLRNSVAHASKFSPDPSDVLEYINRAEELAIKLTALRTRLNLPREKEQDSPAAP